MTQRICSALLRALAGVLAFFAPPTGARRLTLKAPPLRDKRPAPGRTTSGLGLLVALRNPPRLPSPSARRRRRNGQWTDTAGGPLVRPYFLTHEHLREERRRALALALDGIDIGPWIIHGHRIGAPAIPGMAVLGMGTAA